MRQDSEGFRFERSARILLAANRTTPSHDSSINQFVVSEPLAAPHQPKVSDQAALSAAHPSESDFSETPHRTQHASRSGRVNS